MREDSLENFQRIIEEYADDQHVQKQLFDLIENLYKDLEMSKNTISCLQNNTEKLLKSETFGITSKYAALKDEDAALKNKVNYLENVVDELSTQIIAKDAEMKKIISEKEGEMQAYYSVEIAQKDEQIKQKEEELRVNVENHQKRVQELYTEMETASAFSALQLEQMESNYQKQLGEINKKFKDCFHTCNILRTELYSTKEKCNEYKRKIAELQKLYKEPQNQDIVLNNTVTSSYETPLKENQNSKYEPLEISFNNISTSSELLTTDKSTTFRNKPPVYRGGARFWGEKSKNFNKNKNVLPPLIKLSDEKDNASIPVKKRKLYNPDDLSYLDCEGDAMLS